MLDLFELITGLRMNHAYIRPGGVSQDLPPGAIEKLREFLAIMPEQLGEIRALFDAGPVFLARTKGMSRTWTWTGCMALGVTGPMLRTTGPALGPAQEPALLRLRDLRVRRAGAGRPVTRTAGTWSGWTRWTSRCGSSSSAWTGSPASARPDDPVMIEDAKIGWPARLALGPDGLGPAPDHIAHIMGQSMEALIHHFKLVTEGFRVPAGQAYAAVESPRGELGCHVVSDGGTRPFRVHLRDPSFNNLQALPAMAEGGLVADVIPAVASIDPVMGGVDR